MNSAQKVAAKIYLVFAMAVFSFAAMGKLLSNFSDIKIKNHDPFFTFLTNGQLMVISAIIEITVVFILARVCVRNPMKGVPVVLWLCSVFAIYRVGFQIAPNRAGMCKCFGVGSILGKIESKADMLGLILLLSMFLGGIGLLLWSYIKGCNSNRKNQVINKSIYGFSLFFLLYYSCGIARAQDSFTPLYTAEGIVEEHLLNNSGEILQSNKYPFKVSVDSNGRWQMVWQMYYPQWASTSIENIAYNGTDIFSVVYDDVRLDKNMKPVSNLPLDKHEHPARVCHGPFPVDHSSCVGLLWIAFIGGEFVNHNPLLPPDLLSSNARMDPEAWSTEFQYKQLLGTFNPLIASCSILLDKTKVSSDLIDYPEIDEPGDSDHLEETLQLLQRLKAAKNDELLRGKYWLQESRLIEGIRVPTLFSAMRYSYPGTVQGHYQCVEWEGQVTNIIIHVAPVPLLPKIIGTVNVEDRRFKQRTETQFRNDIWYKLNITGWVLSTNDSKFQGMRMLTRQSVTLRKTGYYFTWVLFGSLISLPVYLFLRKLLRRKHNNS